MRGAFASRVSVLTGGPGVGKTVCTREIVAEAKAANATIALCAPTGRAARRLEEATGHEAQTIHRMLEWMPGREPAFGPGHPLPVDLVIVDESSMLNLRLAEVLLGGLAETTHIVLVGDADQLPPIGAGKPFEDLIASGGGAGGAAEPDLPPGGALDDHHRRPRDQPGPPAAPASQTADQDHDFFFIDRPSPERALETVVEVVAERAPRRFEVDPIRERPGAGADVHAGRSGSTPSTSACRPGSTPTASAALNDRFRIGDRLIQTRNSHELGLMNGSIVFLRADDPDEEAIVVDTDEGGTLVIPYGETGDAATRLRDLGPQGAGLRGAGGGRRLPSLALADADPAAALHGDHPRPQQLRLVGDPAALAAAVGRDDSGGRHSGLAERLRD